MTDKDATCATCGTKIVCRCCKRQREVFPAGLDKGLCEPCALDPHLAFAECKHGDPA